MIPRLGGSFPFPTGLARGRLLDINSTTSNRPQVVPNDLTPPDAPHVVDESLVTPIYEGARYGDAQLQAITFAAAGSLLVLARPPQHQRTLLIIVNDIAGFNIRMNFDSAANVTTGLPIPPGGNVFFDTCVPQNDINVFAPVAGVIQIAYLNLDIHNLQRLA